MCTMISIGEKELLDSIVEWIVADGTTNTSNGSWIVYYACIADQFPMVDMKWLKEHHDVLSVALESQPAVEELLSEKDATLECDNNFNMMFVLNFCKEWDGTLDWGCL